MRELAEARKAMGSSDPGSRIPAPGSSFGQRGSALAAVLVLVVLLTMVGVAMVNSTFTEISVAYNAGDTAAAQYAAEAGLSRAIYELSQNAGWTGTTAAIGDGQYVVTVTSTGTTRNVASTGTRGGGRRVLKAAVKVVPQSAASTVLANTTATVGSGTAGLTVSNDYPSGAASAAHANNKLAAATAMTVNTTGASVVGGLTANGTISGVTCATWAWTCNASASVRAIPEIDVDSAATTSLKYRAQHTFDADGKYLYFKGGDTGRCNSGGAWAFTSTQQCWDYYVNSKSGTLGSGISNPVFYVEFTAGESTTYTTGGGGGGSITTNLPIVIRGRCAGGYNGASTGGGANKCGSGGLNTLTIGKPAGVVSGDLLVAAISVRSANPSTPSGWTLVWCGNSGSSTGGTTCPASSTVSLAVYWKVAGTSEPSTYSGWTTTQKAAGVITAYYNVNTSTPIDVQNGTGYTSSVTSLSTPSITTAVANTMLVASFGAADGADITFGTSVASMPAGMTDEWDVNGGVSSGSASGAAHGAMFDAIQDSIGATGQKTVTMSTSAVAVAHLLALKPTTATVATSSGGSAPTFRAASSANTTVSCGSPCISLTISVPAGVVNGDVMIANIVALGTTSIIQAPAGWTLIRRTTSDMTLTTVSYLEQAVYYRVAAGEPANYAWTSTATAGSMVGGISAYSGVDTTTPVDVENVEWVAAVPNYANTSLPAPSVVTTVANDMLVASFAATLNGSPPPALTGPAGWNSRYSTTYNAEAQSSDLVQATAGLTAAIRAIAPSTRGQGFGHLLALRPVGGGGAATVSCGGSTYTETLCLRATPASPYPNSVLSQVTGAIVMFRRPMSVRGSASATISGSTSLTVSKPAGVVDNDVMIAQIAVSSTTATSTPPAGWTFVRRMINSVNGALTTEIFRKVASGEGASYVWSYTGSQSITGGIIAYSGVDTTTPIDVENGQTTSGPSPSTPTVTTTAANDMLVAMFAISASTAFTAPTGMTERYDPTNALGAPSIEGADQMQNAAGATGSKTATTLAGTAAATGELLALRPSSTTVAGDIVFENMASASANYTHTYQGSDPALLAAGKISMISSGASAGRTSTSITGIVYTFAGSDNPDGSSNLQGVGNLGFDLQHGANGITLTLSGLLLSNGSISLQDTGGTGTAVIQYNRTVVENLPAAFTASTAGSILIPLSWSSGD